MHEPGLILEQQAHLVNFKNQRIKHMVGIREIILKRNKLGDKFALALQKAITYDRYIKVINIAGNQISQIGLKTIVKLALLENNSVIAFDARLNPGSTDKVQRQLALCMLKNIEKMKLKNIPIKPEWIRWELVSVGVPPVILKNLGIRNPDEKTRLTTIQTRSSANNKQAGLNGSIFTNSSIGQVNLSAVSEQKKMEPTMVTSGEHTVGVQRV